jgi:hypothetical protein
MVVVTRHQHVLCVCVLVTVVCGSLPDVYVEKLLGFIASALERCGHLQFYLSWSQSLLTQHGQKLKTRWVLLATNTP